MERYRVMSFDGGPGGLTFLHCLQKIERLKPGFLARTDMFVGSSLGARIALYLGQRIAEVRQARITGDQLLTDCLAFVERATDREMPDGLGWMAAWARFIAGDGPLAATVDPGDVMRKAYGSDAVLRDLGARVVVQSARVGAPFEPRVYDSARPEDGDELLWQVALRSGALPLVDPVRDGEVDGAMFSNNPAITGLGRALHGAGNASAVPLEQVCLLTLGQDDGGEELSLSAPGPGIDELREELERLLDRLPGGQVGVAQLLAGVGLTSGISPQVALGVQGVIPALMEKVERAIRNADTAPASGPLEWGWPEWLAYPLNVLFLLQVLVNSQGRGAAAQCRDLLGARTFRLAPSWCPTNWAVALLLLDLPDVAISLGGVTAGAWALGRLAPSRDTTMAWVDAYWMAD